MPLALRNFFGIWGIPFLFLLNIGVTVGVVLLDAINPWLAVPVMWFWLYFHLLQTRVMAVIIFVGAIGIPIVASFSSEVSLQLGLYALGVLAVATIVAHIVAALITMVVGF